MLFGLIMLLLWQQYRPVYARGGDTGGKHESQRQVAVNAPTHGQNVQPQKDAGVPRPSPTEAAALRQPDAHQGISPITSAADGTPSPLTPPQLASQLPWQSGDIGNPAVSGHSTVEGNSATVSGAGLKIWETTDQLQYLHVPLSGDGQIIARIRSQTTTHAYAKVGVMIKEAPTAMSPYALLATTPGNGIVFQHNFKGGIAAGDYTLPDTWLRMTRIGNTFSMYRSVTGSDWQYIGSQDIVMAETATIGLFVSSYQADQVQTAVFDNIAVVQ
jgi:hypothetical protein